VVVAIALAGAALTVAWIAAPRPTSSSGRCHATAASCSKLAPTGEPSSAAPTSSAASTTVSRRRSRPRPERPKRIDDGSLGAQAPRVACKLLTRTEIFKEFGGPVGPATPTFPYCQWLVGEDSLLALEVMPNVSFDTATQYVDTLVTVDGLGQRAIIANNRYLYFTEGSTSYWLLFQMPGDFSSLHTAQLVALGHDVLANGPPAKELPPVPLGPPGPPIYFAGDSTAAGPEWAWWAYHENRTTTRTLAEYQVGTGLVRGDFFDWPQHLLAVAAARRPRLVIWMGSANDGQAIVVNGRYQPVGSALWDSTYATTVGDTMRSLVDEGCKVLWIGEPAMQSPSLNSYMRVIDAIFAEEAAKIPGVVFFNPGTVLNGPGGSYAGSLVIDGQLTPVRLDGVHLNQAGSVVLADAIAKIVSTMLGVKVPS
jgi:lysophospholipase L1-like esterase